MKKGKVIELPGYVTVAGAADRLRLADRSVRDLIYIGRVPSARLGRRHFLRISDVEAERRRRLGLPLLHPKVFDPRQRVRRQSPTPRHGRDDSKVAPRADALVKSEARRERAQERAAQLERWLRSGHAPGTPRIPFATFELVSGSTQCDSCQRSVRPGGRMVDADAADGRPAARLCLTCARRALLAWSDSRRRESVSARLLAQELGTTYTSLLEPASGGT